MKVLLVTEKCGPSPDQRDGGARLATTIQNAFGSDLSIMQFGSKADTSAKWHFDYPIDLPNRFEKRIANADFIAKNIKAVEKNFTHVIFIHISMQFGLINFPLRKEIKTWTFPMFLTPSYKASGENVPKKYTKMEQLALANSKNILTPSYLEKKQLTDFYLVPEKYIHVIPRGIDTKFIKSKVRYLDTDPNFCSVGSIKSQKNILGLIKLFAKIRDRFPGAILKIIGPTQDDKYFSQVIAKIKEFNLSKSVELTGYVPPNQLAAIIDESHVHISTSTCETFGRSIFETLACGLPNIAMIKNNAAAEFLQEVPYIKFVNNNNEALNAIEEIFTNLPKLSEMAFEVGELYDDELLSKLLVAKIGNNNPIAISDFDGTLFHKDDTKRTLESIEYFSKFPTRIICSARPIHDLLDKLSSYNLTVDWIIGYSGAMITDGNGKLLWSIPINKDDVSKLKRLMKKLKIIEEAGDILQVAAPAELSPNILGLRTEIYQKTAFFANWRASKLRAVHKLLRHINWEGKVIAFGDGPYDNELLNYFDGINVKLSTFKNKANND